MNLNGHTRAIIGEQIAALQAEADHARLLAEEAEALATSYRVQERQARATALELSAILEAALAARAAQR